MYQVHVVTLYKGCNNLTSAEPISFLFSHAAGDVAMIKPSNLPDVVEEFISLLELDADQLFSLEQNDPGKWNATWLLYSTDGSA